MGPAGSVPAACLLVLTLAASSAFAQQAGFGRGERYPADSDNSIVQVPAPTGSRRGSESTDNDTSVKWMVCRSQDMVHCRVR